MLMQSLLFEQEDSQLTHRNAELLITDYNLMTDSMQLTFKKRLEFVDLRSHLGVLEGEVFHEICVLIEVDLQVGKKVS